MTINTVLRPKIISILKKKFLEELIPYFLFTVILVSDTSRKKNLEYNKTIQFGRSVAITYGTDL
jgi:hypothetical protein